MKAREPGLFGKRQVLWQGSAAFSVIFLAASAWTRQAAGADTYGTASWLSKILESLAINGGTMLIQGEAQRTGPSNPFAGWYIRSHIRDSSPSQKDHTQSLFDDRWPLTARPSGLPSRETVCRIDDLLKSICVSRTRGEDRRLRYRVSV
jgi:hypothetical protein